MCLVQGEPGVCKSGPSLSFKHMRANPNQRWIPLCTAMAFAAERGDPSNPEAWLASNTNTLTARCGSVGPRGLDTFSIPKDFVEYASRWDLDAERGTISSHFSPEIAKTFQAYDSVEGAIVCHDVEFHLPSLQRAAGDERPWNIPTTEQETSSPRGNRENPGSWGKVMIAIARLASAGALDPNDLRFVGNRAQLIKAIRADPIWRPDTAMAIETLRGRVNALWTELALPNPE